jgi:hypothetical protein
MAKITINTTIRQLSVTEKVKPTSPTWTVLNAGSADLILEGIFTVKPKESFGIDSSAIAAYALQNNLEIENGTEFNIKFLDVSKTITDAGGTRLDNVESTKGIALLFETSYKLVK